MISLPMFLFGTMLMNKKHSRRVHHCLISVLLIFFFLPLWYYATKENGGWKLYDCTGIYLHCARRHFLTVTWGADPFFFSSNHVVLKSNAKCWLK